MKRTPSIIVDCEDEEGIQIEFDLDEMDGNRLERTLRHWINSFSLEDIFVTDNLYQELQDGIIILKVCDKILPGCVDFTKVAGIGLKKKVMSPFDVQGNCDLAIVTCEKVIGSAVGMHGWNIFNLN